MPRTSSPLLKLAFPRLRWLAAGIVVITIIAAFMAASYISMGNNPCGAACKRRVVLSPTNPSHMERSVERRITIFSADVPLLITTESGIEYLKQPCASIVERTRDGVMVELTEESNQVWVSLPEGQTGEVEVCIDRIPR